MSQIITKSGFEIDIDKTVLDDMELFECIVDVDKGRADRIPEMLNRMLTPDQKKTLYDHCRDESGRVRMTKVETEIEEIFDGLRDPEKK